MTVEILISQQWYNASDLDIEAAVYADRPYESNDRSRWFKSIGINDRIMHRSHKNQPRLPHWQQPRNKLISWVRAPVEKVFGALKRTYGYRRVRYMDHKRNKPEMWLKLMAYNVRRTKRLMFSR